MPYPSFDEVLGIPRQKGKTRRPIDKSTKDAVWFRYMGKKSEGKCYCCRIRTIHITDFQVGHNKAVAKGGRDNISNLRPICGPCNRGMGTMSIEKYRAKYYAKPKKTTRKIRKKKTRKKESPIYGEIRIPTRKDILGF